MAVKQKKKKELTPYEKELEKMKYEIASELGLVEKINIEGWDNLTAREAGKIGGIMSRRLRKSSN